MCYLVEQAEEARHEALDMPPQWEVAATSSDLAYDIERAAAPNVSSRQLLFL